MSKDMKENQSLRVFFNRLWNVSSVQPFSVECSSQGFHSWPFFGLQIANPSFCGYLLDCYGLTSYIFLKYLRFSDLRIIKTAENINSNNEVPYISLRYFLCSEKTRIATYIQLYSFTWKSNVNLRVFFLERRKQDSDRLRMIDLHEETCTLNRK